MQFDGPFVSIMNLRQVRVPGPGEGGEWSVLLDSMVDYVICRLITPLPPAPAPPPLPPPARSPPLGKLSLLARECFKGPSMTTRLLCRRRGRWYDDGILYQKQFFYQRDRQSYELEGLRVFKSEPMLSIRMKFSMDLVWYGVGYEGENCSEF